MVAAGALLSLAAPRDSFAGAATWSANPISGDWNTVANWIPATVPNGPSDVATFGTSNRTSLSTNITVELDSIVFNSGASLFTITSGAGTNLLLTGTGVVNNSGIVQSLIKIPNGAVFFFNNATAGELTSFSGTFFFFNDSSSAGSASFDVTSDGFYQPFIQFLDTTTAADATITVSDFGVASVYDNATAGNATFTVNSGAFLFIADHATAEHAVATCIGGNGIYGSSIDFQQFASAGEGHFTALGATTSGEAGSDIEFTGSATAANGTFVINGGTAPGLAGAFLSFLDTTTADNATITASGGASGAEGGAIIFADEAQGGTASISLLGNGELDISGSRLRGVTIGSLAGDGLVFLGAKTLTIGSNNQSTAFAGIIQESGSLTKIGTGTLTLSGASTYTGTTTIRSGILSAANPAGSATGTGAVNVKTGTLGGAGMIAGATTIGTGSGPGAFLVPAVGSSQQTSLTLLSALILNADATYTCTFKAKKNKARTDLVIAHGVTINGAILNLSGQTQGSLKRGLTLTVLSNTSADPISGTFSNLPNGGIVTISGNNFQATYEGGDGNDLTLTVVP